MRPRFTIMHQPFIATSETDDFGNKVEAWDESEPVLIYGFSEQNSTEPGPGHNSLSIEGKMLVPPSFVCGFRDRFTGLPGVPSGRVYEAVGVPKQNDRNPFRWNPGGSVKVRYISG